MHIIYFLIKKSKQQYYKPVGYFLPVQYDIIVLKKHRAFAHVQLIKIKVILWYMYLN